MIAAGTTSVDQNSGEFFLNIDLSTSVFIIIVLAAFSSCYVSGELVERMRIVDFSAHDASSVIVPSCWLGQPTIKSASRKSLHVLFGVGVWALAIGGSIVVMLAFSPLFLFRRRKSSTGAPRSDGHFSAPAR
jgi:hypothetical protein